MSRLGGFREFQPPKDLIQPLPPRVEYFDSGRVRLASAGASNHVGRRRKGHHLPSRNRREAGALAKAKYFSQKYGISLDWFYSKPSYGEIYDMARKIVEEEKQKRIEQAKKHAKRHGWEVIVRDGLASSEDLEKICGEVDRATVIYEDRIVECIDGAKIHASFPKPSLIAMELLEIVKNMPRP